MSSSIQLEVAVESVESARAAQEGGATRVELCSALVLGGLTPSAGLIAVVRRSIQIPLHVLIRPRAGDFFYSDDEFQIMHRDILLARQLGANGVAVGVLDTNRNIDVDRTHALVEAAAPMEVTFHRAFDVAANRELALPLVFAAGATRILTSGGAPTAEEGSTALRKLVFAAGSDISIVAAGKIRVDNVARLIRETGVREVHANLATPVGEPSREAPNAPAASPFASPRTAVTPETIRAFLVAASQPS